MFSESFLRIETNVGDHPFFLWIFFSVVDGPFCPNIEPELRELKRNGVRVPKLSTLESYFTHFPKQILFL